MLTCDKVWCSIIAIIKRQLKLFRALMRAFLRDWMGGQSVCFAPNFFDRRRPMTDSDQRVAKIEASNGILYYPCLTFYRKSVFYESAWRIWNEDRRVSSSSVDAFPYRPLLRRSKVNHVYLGQRVGLTDYANFTSLKTSLQLLKAISASHWKVHLFAASHLLHR